MCLDYGVAGMSTSYMTKTSHRISGSHLCSWGTGGDWANGCENVALPGFDLCPTHEKISVYLENEANAWHHPACVKYGDDSQCNACNGP